MPAPTDIAHINGVNPVTGEDDVRPTSDEEPVSALAFKIATDPFVGKLGFFRVYSGVISAGSYVYNSTKEKRERAESKGVTRRFRYTVVGIPNTGKSTVVNLLGGAKRAKTGDIAGVTRDVRWIKCADFDLLDTPGTMPPSCKTQYLARHLAYIGSLNDDILDIADVALELLKELKGNYPAALQERYGIDCGGNDAETDKTADEEERTREAVEMLETACRRRGFILRGGEFDYERGARAVIDDFRKGRLGKICLENPSDFADVKF